ncbi:hemolysin III [Cytobacillus horneckiae]|uniref:Hemolysin n=1 Tax=Cytobacillus horneckiae TaxID=549687 RepID=A0A2N0ZC86_9BACI|nr:hemolysin III family protein [Cytobacillus horneckiae]MBN6885997.1 hemolysin III family protein [Cytobacillus horneckiae]MCM3177539.1 hemolysin III family protein [Cytobacillus horneckiae]MEC1155897.1 hemolysin III family protein [Cytobacillus horneckiae]MED2939827.1 hemolysin III family protein [Cytobacillus horneckiae]PKG27127.1 hemolysin [Cytobacillus horneckiae]
MTAYIREPINSLTHLAGAILSFIALLAMVIKASLTTASPMDIAAVIIFGISMMLLYSASAAYHMIIAKGKVIAFFRKIDHSMIFVLIAGSYAPFCLISLDGALGSGIFTFVAVTAILGVVFKMVWFNCPRWLSTCLYIALGWVIVFAFAPLSKTLSIGGLLLLLQGGIFYTIGGVIYAVKPKFMEFKHLGFHEIFHIFIMLGTTCHFLSVYIYVL